MFLSESDGWSDVVRIHPSVRRLLLSFVVPMSLIPAVMYAYSWLLYPGSVFPLVEPPPSLREAAVVGIVFVLAQLAMVMLMTAFIQRACESIDLAVGHERAFALAAIAPTPLWLSALALFVPVMWLNALVVAVAWIGCVALIRHGIRPLIGLQDARRIRWMTNVLTLGGVLAWAALMILMGILLSLMLGWR
jgi:hypothetical protein